MTKLELGEYYSNALNRDRVGFNAWDYPRNRLKEEVQWSRVARQRDPAEAKVIRSNRRHAKSVFAAELFFDGKGIQLEIADDEDMDHDDLRATEGYPSTEACLSGEVVSDGVYIYFSFDRVMIGLDGPDKVAVGDITIGELAKRLLVEGYFPVDSMFEAIPTA